MGVVMFMGVGFLLGYKDLTTFGEEGKILIFVGAALTVAAVGTSFTFQNVLAAKVTAAQSLREAREAYQVMCLIRWAMAEGAAFFCLVVFIVHQDLAAVALAVVCMAFMVLRGPSQRELESYSVHAGANSEP